MLVNEKGQTEVNFILKVQIILCHPVLAINKIREDVEKALWLKKARHKQ